MAIHLGTDVIRQLLVSENRITIFSKKPPKVKDLDLDSFHRKFRIMAKKGLVEPKDIGDFIHYTITPKGKLFVQRLKQSNAY